MYKQVTAPREEPLSKRRITSSLITLGVVVLLALLIPLPLFVDADFLVQPEKLAPVSSAKPLRARPPKVEAFTLVKPEPLPLKTPVVLTLPVKLAPVSSAKPVRAKPPNVEALTLVRPEPLPLKVPVELTLPVKFAPASSAKAVLSRPSSVSELPASLA